jgi:hypothetical protein
MIRTDGLQDIGGEVVSDLPGTAGEGPDEVARVTLRPQDNGGQAQYRGPPFGARRQRTQLSRGKAADAGAAEERGDLLFIEAKLFRADLGELIICPPAAKGQLRIPSCRKHQLEAGRPAIGEEGQRLCHRRAFGEVIILQNQDKVAGGLVEFLDQDRKDIGLQPLGPPAQRRERAPPGQGCDLGQGRQQVRPEPDRVGVSRIERHPGGIRGDRVGDPLRQQRGLAVTGGGAYQRQRAASSRGQFLEQARARDRARRLRRGLELGPDQRDPAVAPGPRMARPGRRADQCHP